MYLYYKVTESTKGSAYGFYITYYYYSSMPSLP